MREGAKDGSMAVDVRATVQNAMASLPAPLRRLLESVGATRYEVVGQTIGEAVDHFRRSAGLPGSQEGRRAG